MVAHAAAGAGFYPGQRIRLLVSFLAWVDRDRLSGRPVPPACRFVGPHEALTFVAYRADAPGGCLVRDEGGVVYRCPLDYLEELA